MREGGWGAEAGKRVDGFVSDRSPGALFVGVYFWRHWLLLSHLKVVAGAVSKSARSSVGQLRSM